MSYGMNPTEARLRFTAARVAVLGTADASGAPHLVPITFVVDGDAIYSAVDGKPKRSTRLRRHDNIQAQPSVSVLVEHWAENWSRLWWVRADGLARVSGDPSTVQRVVDLLTRKYDQYHRVGVGGPVIEVDVHTWQGWSGQE
jgi:PPOX class probable F420-dependent enzyme